MISIHFESCLLMSFLDGESCLLINFFDGVKRLDIFLFSILARLVHGHGPVKIFYKFDTSAPDVTVFDRVFSTSIYQVVFWCLPDIDFMLLSILVGFQRTTRSGLTSLHLSLVKFLSFRSLFLKNWGLKLISVGQLLSVILAL